MEQKLENMLTVSDDVISASIIDVELHIPGMWQEYNCRKINCFPMYIERSSIHVSFNVADREIILFVKQHLYKMLMKELEKIVQECGISKKYANIPIKVCIC